MTVCPRCSAPVDVGARFCQNCGFALSDAPREERRIVTVLFADLVGFTAMSEKHDPEAVKRIVDRIFDGLAEIVTVYGGRVDKIIGDEIMAVFGAPQAHEDDPERAARCALEMMRALGQFSLELLDRGDALKMRIGINTGEVVAGHVGGVEGTYTVVGDAVNVASRLVKAAEPGSILVGPSTYATTESAIEYRELEPMFLKGKQDAIPVYEAIAERALPGEHRRRTEAPLVGRDEELRVLEGLSDIAARDRRAMAVTILGDAGMGKSRLAEEFARRLPDARVLAGRSLPYGTATPSFAVEEMVRAALGLTGSEDPASARAKIGEKLAGLGLVSELERIATLAGVRETETVPATAAPRRGGAAGPAAGGSSSRGREQFQTAAAFFEALAAKERLLVLIFHELHWAEQSLIELVGDLVERARTVPLLMMALGRPELMARATAWTSRPGSTTLQLAPLGREAAAKLLDELAGGALHPSVRENVLERAGGNPFYIEEFVRLLLDKSGRERGTVRNLGPAASVPVSVQALVAARLDTLESHIKRVVQDAAVIGEQFWFDALAALDPALDAETLDAALRDLVDRELIEPVDHPMIPDQREFRFRQAIVREVAYSGVPKQIRAHRHELLAGWLEQITTASGLQREFYDLIAYHYERAAAAAKEVGIPATEATQKARDYLEKAGDEAMSKDAAAAAAQFYERALAFATSDEDALHLRVHLGEAYVGRWVPQEAEAHLTRALTDARRLGNRQMEAKALRLLGDLSRIRGDLDIARDRLEQALEIARDIGDRQEEAEGLRSHGLLDMFQGRIPSSPLWFRQALTRYRELGDKRGEGWSLQNLGWANLLLGRVDEALDYLTEAATVFQELGDLEGVGWCLGLRSWGLLFEGKIDEADELARQIEELITSGIETDNPGGMGGVGWGIERVLRAIVAVERLQFDQAITMARETAQTFDEAEFNWGHAMAGFPIGIVHILRLEFGLAKTVLEEAVAVAHEGGDPLVEGLLCVTLAYAEFSAGNLDRAESLAREAYDLASNAGVGWHSEIAHRWVLADIHRQRGDLDSARKLLEEAVTFKSSSLFTRGRARVLLAEVLCDLGRPADGAEAARIAIDEAGPALFDLVDAQASLARAHVEMGDLAAALETTTQALATLEHGQWDAQRVRVLALRAKVLDELGRHDEANEVHDRARALIASFSPDADVSSLAQMISA